VVRLNEMVDTTRELLASALAAHLSLLSVAQHGGRYGTAAQCDASYLLGQGARPSMSVPLICHGVALI